MALSRNQQHYIIMSVIYIELNDFNYGEKGLSRTAKEMMELLLQEYNEEKVPLFVEDMINVSLLNYGEAVAKFNPYLKAWKWERLPLLTQSILLMSYAHYYKIEKISKAIVINIAVDLAKQYIDEKQAKFINGILNNALN